MQARIGREIARGDRCLLGDLEIEVVDAERFRVRWVTVQAPMPKVEEEETPTEAE